MTRQIREQLDALINAGALAAGTPLPSEAELANELKVARNVVRGAYEQLMDAGKIRGKGRKGKTVRPRGNKRRLNDLLDKKVEERTVGPRIRKALGEVALTRKRIAVDQKEIQELKTETRVALADIRAALNQ